MARFYRCEECGHQIMAGDKMARESFKCGAIVEYVYADNPEAQDDDLVSSQGIKPLGCGGTLLEISEEEAMKNV